MKTIGMKRCPLKESVLEDYRYEMVASEDYCGEDYSYTWDDSEDVPVVDLDIEETIRSVQTRTDNKQSQEHIASWAQAMNANNVFTGPVLYKGKNGKWLIWDGLHTCQSAIKAGATHIRGHYKFNGPRPHEMVGAFNGKTNGVGEDLKAKIAAAALRYLEMAMTFPAAQVPSKKEYASKLSLPEGDFCTQCRRAEARAILSREGVQVTKIIDDTSVEMLGKLHESHPVEAVEIAKLTTSHGLRAGDVKEIVTDFTTAKSLSDKATVLKTKRLSLKSKPNKPKPKRKSGPDSTLQDAVTKIFHISELGKTDIRCKNLFLDPSFKNKAAIVMRFLKKNLV